MFGNAPRALWSRWVDIDAQHRIALCCRTLLVEEPGRRILFETGIGAYMTPKFRERFGVVESQHVLLESLDRRGLTHEDIDIVVLSHLHFDHAGGLLATFAEGQDARLLFPNAQFMVHKRAWERCRQPHYRDRASFIPGLDELLDATGRLIIVDAEEHELLGPAYRFHTSEGHTPGLLVTEIDMPAGPVVFAADLIPGVPWVHLPITMGYDRFPERLVDEKTTLLTALEARGGRIFFTHDHQTALARVTRDDRGRFGVADPHASIEELAQ